MHDKKGRMMKSFILTAAVFMAVAAFFPRIAAALGTPAGTAITNTATATYQDALANSFSSVSNSTTVTVDAVYSVAITSPPDQSVPSNTVAYYPYTLTNTGNATNNFNLSAASAAGGNNFVPVTLYVDSNNDGTHQAGEITVVANPVNIVADGTFRFFVAVTVPVATPNGQADDTILTVTGTGDPGAGDDMTDTVTTTAQAPALAVLKEVRNVTDAGGFAAAATAAPAEILEYRLTVTNNGTVDATTIVLSDPINGNTGFVVGSAVFTPGTSTLPPATAAQYSNDAGATWAYVPASGGCAAPAGADYCVTHIRWAPAGAMPLGGTTFNTLFRVRVK